MQSYAIRMHNFLRFGETGNSIVFDLTPQEKQDMKDGKITMDQIYDRVMTDPVKHIVESKRRGLEKILGIKGLLDGNIDFSNGTGKSTIMEGMCYSRYERIVRRTAQNPDKIERAGVSTVTKINGKYNPNMRESWVEELMETGGRIYKIRRGREFQKNHKSNSPIIEAKCLYEGAASMTGHRRPETKDNISDILTMDYDIFVNSQMFGQNDAGKYLNGTDKTKKEMLISLLRLEDVVSKCLENVREKKNSQVKKIDGIKAAIDLIEKDFCRKCSILNSRGLEEPFDDTVITSTMLSLKEVQNICQIKIKEIESDIVIHNSKIVELSKSDKIQKVEDIKEEGRITSKELKSKEQEMESQIAQWGSIQKDLQDSFASKTSQMNTISSKIQSIQSKINDSKKIISDFDLTSHQNNLKIVEKAKQAKDPIGQSLSDYRNKLTNELSNKAVSADRISECKKLINKLKSQISSVGDDGRFACPECENIVAKEHIIAKMEALSAKENVDVNLSASIDTNIETLRSKVSEYEKKANKISEFLLSEGKTIAAIKSFEDAKNGVSDLESRLNDENNNLKGITEELQKIKSQQEEYSKKVIEIRSSYSERISTLKSVIDKLIAKLKNANAEAKAISDQLDLAKSEKAKSEKDRDRTIEQYGSSCKDYEHFEKKKEDLEGKHKAHMEEAKILSRWLILEDIYGLDGIQTRIIKKYLPLLNIYIKEFLDILSDGMMTVKMSINDKLKIDMLISGGTSEVYEMLSGGEKMIVRLAVDIGLSLLAFSRTAQKPEMICLDEVFGPLDNFHTEKVFQILQRLQDKFSRIIIITHKPDINDRLKSHIVVEKSGGVMGLSKVKCIE